jgi:hypothetical protein
MEHFAVQFNSPLMCVKKTGFSSDYRNVMVLSNARIYCQYKRRGFDDDDDDNNNNSNNNIFNCKGIVVPWQWLKRTYINMK